MGFVPFRLGGRMAQAALQLTLGALSERWAELFALIAWSGLNFGNQAASIS